ncbi:unnamed protein product, partial [Ixodes pacificus]
YLGRSHNLWHRACLLLEQGALERVSKGGRGGPEEPGESLDCLAELYGQLREEDLWGGLWQRRARHPETALALALEQQGCFEQAQGALEAAMARARQDHATLPASPLLQSEFRLWEEHWLRCSKELNQWDLLLDYGSSKNCANPHLVLESAWRVPNWALMKEALLQRSQNPLRLQVELGCPKEQAWRVNLYRGYIAICHPEEQHLSLVERVVEVITSQCIREWRRLPHVVSHVHLPLLQAAQQIMELQEAAQIHQGLLPANAGRNTSLYDMRAIVKTWRNRLPVLSDDLSHWSDVFTWRQHHYQACLPPSSLPPNAIVNHYDSTPGPGPEPQANQAMLGVHASAQSIIHYGKVARKHGLTNVCLDSLSRIHTIPSVPIVDCFQKIRQQVKCYLQMSNMMGKNELQEVSFTATHSGLDVIESTNLKYFTKDMTAEFYALKGLFLSQMGRSEEANKALSAAVQMHDTLVKAWALWGDYLETLFARDRWEARQLPLGVSALTCFLHACRHQNEPKARKYLAKVLWLLTYDDERGTLAEAADKYNAGVPPMQWLPWIPQLLTCLVRAEGRLLLNLLVQIGRVYPQAVYFPIRTLYLTLKIEQRERCKPGSAHGSGQGAQSGEAPSPNTGQGGATGELPTVWAKPHPPGGESGPIRATPSMWRCSKIMHMQRDLHPTVLSSLEGIVDQMVWFRENWYEEVLRQLRQGLAKCHAVAFENRGAVSEATVTPHTLNFLKKLVSTFGVGIENVSSVSTTFSNAASESLARRAQATAQDPVFQKMKGQFTTDFDFSVPGAMKLHNLINKLKKWIKILEAKTKLLPKSLLIEEKCRFLSNFSQQTAELFRFFYCHWQSVAIDPFFLLPAEQPLLCAHCPLHASRGDSAEAQHRRTQALHTGPERKDLPVPGGERRLPERRPAGGAGAAAAAHAQPPPGQAEGDGTPLPQLRRAPGGGRQPPDATRRGQPGLRVPAPRLQAALPQAGRGARLSAGTLLRAASGGAGPWLPGEPPGAAGHPQGRPGVDGASPHAQGLGTSRLPAAHALLDLPQAVHPAVVAGGLCGVCDAPDPPQPRHDVPAPGLWAHEPLLLQVRRGRHHRRPGCEPTGAVPVDAQHLGVHHQHRRDGPHDSLHDRHCPLRGAAQLQGPGAPAGRAARRDDRLAQEEARRRRGSGLSSSGHGGRAAHWDGVQGCQRRHDQATESGNLRWSGQQSKHSGGSRQQPRQLVPHGPSLAPLA